MDHVRLHPARPKPTRQPEALAAGFEGKCDPRDLAAGLDRLVAPAMQQAKVQAKLRATNVFKTIEACAKKLTEKGIEFEPIDGEEL